LIVVIEPPIAFLPRLGALTLELFAKVFTNQRMRVQLSSILRIFLGKEFCSS
jgi:hypothetical protein